MLSIIIYATDPSYLDRTIDDLLDHTPGIVQIVVCNDAGFQWSRDGVQLLHSDRVGRAKSWNLAAAQATGDILVFLKAKTKLTSGWSEPLVAKLSGHPKALASPVVHTLDLTLWQLEDSRWLRFGWRWDLSLYDRPAMGRPESPALSSYCIACGVSWFRELGGFDDGMGLGTGEDIELSLRSWLLGGEVLVCDDSAIGVALEVDYNPQTVNNLSRVVEAWFPDRASFFYQARGVKGRRPDTGRLQNLLALQARQVRQAEWFFATLQPELFSVYSLRGSAAGKSVAVVAAGPSLDWIDPAWLNRHDIVIAVDFAGLVVAADFVATDAVHVVSELKARYRDQQFLVPIALEDRAQAQRVAAAELVPGAQQFEQAVRGAVPVAVDPPFCDFGSMTMAAIQFALFLGPVQVVVFGCDHKIVGGQSHTSKVEHYDGGRLWPDSESSRQQFAFWEYGMDQLGRLANAAGIPLLRVSHA